MTHDGFDTWHERLIVEAEAGAFILIATVVRFLRWMAGR